VTARPFRLATLLLATLPLGCSERLDMGYADPAKYQPYNCGQLQLAIKPLNERATELKALYARAAVDQAGTLVARVTYEPEYLTAVGNIEAIEQASRDRNCDPPITGAHPGPLR
jgi:hypothetical protein